MNPTFEREYGRKLVRNLKERIGTSVSRAATARGQRVPGRTASGPGRSGCELGTGKIGPIVTFTQDAFPGGTALKKKKSIVYKES